MVADLPLVRMCDQGRSGALRLSTPFCYPNGESIDMFLTPLRELFTDFSLSDSGQTALYLHNAQVSLESTARKREAVADILRDSGVSLSGGQLSIRINTTSPEMMADAIFRLSQICMRLSDLATHQRLRSANPFRDDVEDFFEAHNLTYDTDFRFPPVFGKRELRMDFEVRDRDKVSYVNVIAALNEAAAHSTANEIAVKLGDLQRTGRVPLQSFVTVYNSASAAIRTEDIERLATLSNTVPYPDADDNLLLILRGEGMTA